MQSGVGKLSCNKTALKRCTSTETLRNRKAPSLSSPEDEEIFLPKLPKSWHADVFKGPSYYYYYYDCTRTWTAYSQPAGATKCMECYSHSAWEYHRVGNPMPSLISGPHSRVTRGLLYLDRSVDEDAVSDEVVIVEVSVRGR